MWQASSKEQDREYGGASGTVAVSHFPQKTSSEHSGESPKKSKGSEEVLYDHPVWQPLSKEHKARDGGSHHLHLATTTKEYGKGVNPHFHFGRTTLPAKDYHSHLNNVDSMEDNWSPHSDNDINGMEFHKPIQIPHILRLRCHGI